MASKRSRGWWSPILPWHDCKMKIQIFFESGSDEGPPIWYLRRSPHFQQRGKSILGVRVAGVRHALQVREPRLL
jgi:hypothetical protein